MGISTVACEFSTIVTLLYTICLYAEPSLLVDKDLWTIYPCGRLWEPVMLYWTVYNTPMTMPTMTLLCPIGQVRQKESNAYENTRSIPLDNLASEFVFSSKVVLADILVYLSISWFPEW